MTCHDSRCIRYQKCMGFCDDLRGFQAQKEQTNMIPFMELEKMADERIKRDLNIAYRRGWADAGQEMLPRYDALREELDYTRHMMWFAFIGWVVTALLFLYFNG